MELQTLQKDMIAAMKARVSGTPAGRDAVDKTKGKEMHLLYPQSKKWLSMKDVEMISNRNWLTVSS